MTQLLDIRLKQNKKVHLLAVATMNTRLPQGLALRYIPYIDYVIEIHGNPQCGVHESRSAMRLREVK